jgi:hypothetical protein
MLNYLTYVLIFEMAVCGGKHLISSYDIDVLVVAYRSKCLLMIGRIYWRETLAEFYEFSRRNLIQKSKPECDEGSSRRSEVLGANEVVQLCSPDASIGESTPRRLILSNLAFTR